MKARSTTNSITSNSVWKYINLLDGGDLPNEVTISNVGDIAVYIRWMNLAEGNGETNDKYYLSAGTSRTIRTESSEKPINRIGVLLYTGAIATNVIISSINYEVKN